MKRTRITRFALLAGVAALVTAAGASGAAQGDSSASTSSASGDCSKATALQVATRFQVVVDPTLANPIAGVLCGAFAGPGSQVMIATFARGTCLPNFGWTAFRFTGGAWQLVPNGSHPGPAFLAAAGSDIRETVPIWRKGDGHCFPGGGTKSRVWQWNGTRFSAGVWKQATTGDPKRRGFYSPSRNIACGIFDDSTSRGVNCQSRIPPQNVTMQPSGRVTICRDPTPNNVTNECNLGDPGEGVIPVLAYGRQITVGRFRCLSLPVGVKCTVISSGKGFLINRDGVSRVGS
jgi:hypothetical protein